jgi:hypothetical protein
MNLKLIWRKTVKLRKISTTIYKLIYATLTPFITNLVEENHLTDFKNNRSNQTFKIKKNYETQKYSSISYFGHLLFLGLNDLQNINTRQNSTWQYNAEFGGQTLCGVEYQTTCGIE